LKASHRSEYGVDRVALRERRDRCVQLSEMPCFSERNAKDTWRDESDAMNGGAEAMRGDLV
jgi:hypothetical protein